MSHIKSRTARELQGTDRPSRKAREDVTPDAPLPETPPDWLSHAAKGHYRRLRPQLEGVATAAAVDIFAAYCQDLATYQKVSKQCVNISDLIEVTGRDTERPSAIATLQNQTAARLLKGAKALALTPEARGVKGPQSKDEKPANAWDAI